MQKYKLFSKYKLFNTKNMEDNKNTTPEQLPLVAKTMRVEQSDHDLWNRVKETLEENFGRKVPDTEVFAEVMARYFLPQKQNQAAAQQLQERDQKIADLKQQLADAQQQLEQARTDANTNAENANSQQLDYENRLQQLQQDIDSKTLKPGEHVIAFRPGYYEVLQRVAELEGRRRNQPWTPADVIGFFTYSRFILGNLNGDLNALPDSECRKIEQQLGISLTGRKAPARKEDAAL